MRLFVDVADASCNLGTHEITRLRASRRRRGLDLVLKHNIRTALEATVTQWTGRHWRFAVQITHIEAGGFPMKTETELLHAVLEQLKTLNQNVSLIAGALAYTQQAEAVSPNLQRQLSEYPGFDWSAIGAEVVKRDANGATIVRWQGGEFFRRRHPDYDSSIWFSRYTGQKDENDRKVYARLITFSDRPRLVKSLPEEVAERLPAPPTEPREPQEPVALPADPKHPAAAATQNPSDARSQFYALLPQLIQAGQLTTEVANELTRRANLEGFAVALAEAEKIAARNAVSDALPPEGEPTGELDRFFPRQ